MLEKAPCVNGVYVMSAQRLSPFFLFFKPLFKVNCCWPLCFFQILQNHVLESCPQTKINSEVACNQRVGENPCSCKQTDRPHSLCLFAFPPTFPWANPSSSVLVGKGRVFLYCTPLSSYHSICILTPIRRTNHREADPPSGVQRSTDRKERKKNEAPRQTERVQ